MPHPFKGDWTMEDEDCLSKRPQLAMHVGIIASLWSYLEARLGDTLGLLLKADRYTGSLMYMQIKSEPARLAVIQALAEDRLEGIMLERFTLLKKHVSKTGAERDRIVHGLWALPTEKTDTIIWHDPRAHAMVLAAASIVSRKGKRATGAEKDRMVAAIEEARKSLLEYTERDFLDVQQRIRERIEEATGLNTDIWWTLDRRQIPPRHRSKARQALGLGSSSKTPPPRA